MRLLRIFLILSLLATPALAEQQLFENNLDTILSAGVTSSDTSLLVADATGFPSPGAEEFFLVTLFTRSGNTVTDTEIVKCTSRSGTTLTVERGQEETTAVSHNAGARVSMMLTAAALERLPTDSQKLALDSAVYALSDTNPVTDQQSFTGHTGDGALHLTSDQNAGLDAATEISSTNRVATVDDIELVANLSPDQAAALNNSTYPLTAANPVVNQQQFSPLADDSLADALHRHSELSASDGDPNPALQVDAAGDVAISGGLAVDGEEVLTEATISAIDLAADHSKLAGVETGADVTDATNVNAAGATMNADTTTAAMSFVLDEDDMVSDSATKVPTQQSVKAYVDSAGGGSAFTTVAKTASYTLTAADCNGFKTFTNAGAAGEISFTLPEGAEGMSVEFADVAIKVIKIYPGSTDVIHFSALPLNYDEFPGELVTGGTYYDGVEEYAYFDFIYIDADPYPAVDAYNPAKNTCLKFMGGKWRVYRQNDHLKCDYYEPPAI